MTEVVSSLAVGVALQLFGGVLLALGYLRAAQLLSIYPGSAIFYLIPRSVTDRLPEPALSALGEASGVILWASILLCLWLTIGRGLTRGCSGRLRRR